MQNYCQNKYLKKRKKSSQEQNRIAGSKVQCLNHLFLIRTIILISTWVTSQFLWHLLFCSDSILLYLLRGLYGEKFRQKQLLCLPDKWTKFRLGVYERDGMRDVLNKNSLMGEEKNSGKKIGFSLQRFKLMFAKMNEVLNWRCTRIHQVKWTLEEIW